jgi:DNA repair exonuclease SbcCD nuclease subunit
VRFKFLHAADLHLDSPLRGLERYEGAPVDRIRSATRRALANLVDTCLEENVGLVLLAGDLFDGDWQDYSTGLYFSGQLARLRDAGTEVVWVRGNHDASSKIRKSLTLPSNVRELPVRRPETHELEQLEVAVHGQGYGSPDVQEDLARRYPRPVSGVLNIGLLHTALTGRPGHEPYAPCALETLVDRGYDYWALGHVHQQEIVAREPYVVFPGNLQGRHVRETGPKGACLVTVDAARVVGVELRAFDVVRWETLSVDTGGLRHFDEVVDRVRSALARLARAAEGRLLAVRVRLTGGCPAHDELVRRAEQLSNQIRAEASDLGEGEVWIEKVQLLTHPEVDMEALGRRSDALGEVASALQRIKGDPGELEALAAELSDLWEKLPLELKEGRDKIPLEGAEAFRDLLQDVERLLLSRLVKGARAEGVE